MQHRSGLCSRICEAAVCPMAALASLLCVLFNVAKFLHLIGFHGIPR